MSPPLRVDSPSPHLSATASLSPSLARLSSKLSQISSSFCLSFNLAFQEKFWVDSKLGIRSWFSNLRFDAGSRISPIPVVAEDNLSIRRLEISDHKKGFVELLSQLTVCPPLSESEFQARFAEIAKLGDRHCIYVIEDPITERIIATGTVFVETKFIRNGSKVGHIEDVVVAKSARGLHLGQRIVKHLVDHAKTAGCYKVILACAPELREFYEKCGFEEKSIQMSIYF